MNKMFLVSCLAIFTVLTLAMVPAVSAALDVSGVSVSVRGEQVSTSDVISGDAGEVIPIALTFTAGQDATAVKVKAEIDGYRNDITAKSGQFNMIDGSLYTKTLSIKLPSDIEPYEDYTLKVSLVSQEDDFGPQEYTFRVQRETYNVAVLDIDCDKTVSAGANLAVDVVLKNKGYERLDDVFVVASIPDLGIEKKAYFEDLTAEDEPDDDKEDSSERRLYLKVPSNTAAGVYELQVEAYNSDTTDVVYKNIAVVAGEKESNIIAPVSVKEMASGESVSYDLVIVNSGDRIGVFEVSSEPSEDVVVTPAESVVVVPAGTSKVVKVNVKGLDEGTHTFTVDVKAGDVLLKQVTMTAVVGEQAFAGNVAILTLVLAIVFVVLLVVLIVLLTRKPGRVEEFEESYY